MHRSRFRQLPKLQPMRSASFRELPKVCHNHKPAFGNSRKSHQRIWRPFGSSRKYATAKNQLSATPERLNHALFRNKTIVSALPKALAGVLIVFSVIHMLYYSLISLPKVVNLFIKTKVYQQIQHIKRQQHLFYRSSFVAGITFYGVCNIKTAFQFGVNNVRTNKHLAQGHSRIAVMLIYV